MTYRSHHKRRPSSFWIFCREYLPSELRAIGHILIMCAGVIFLATALLVGTYQLVRAAVLWLLLK